MPVQANPIIYLGLLTISITYGSVGYAQTSAQDISQATITEIKENKEVSSKLQQPKFVLGKDGKGKCDPNLNSTLNKTLEVSVPKSPYWPKDKEVIQIGLRNSKGEKKENYSVTARVITPDGQLVTAYTTVKGDEFTYLTYPLDFNKAEDTKVGTYTVIWEVNNQVAACDGFLVVESDSDSNVAFEDELEANLTAITESVLSQRQVSFDDEVSFKKNQKRNNTDLIHNLDNSENEKSVVFKTSEDTQSLLDLLKNIFPNNFLESLNFRELEGLMAWDNYLSDKESILLASNLENNHNRLLNPELEPLLTPDTNPDLYAGLYWGSSFSGLVRFFDGSGTVTIYLPDYSTIPEPNLGVALFIFALLCGVGLRKN